MRSKFGVAFRRLRKSPAFTATAVVTLGLCLAGNLALFAIVEAALLRPLPFPQPDRLVAILNSYPLAGYPRAGSSVVNYFERRKSIPALSSVSLYHVDHAVIGDDGAPEQVPILAVTPEFFATLGVAPAQGRTFTEADTQPGADNVAIISDAFWHAFFHASTDVLGRAFDNDGNPVTVVGVLPAGFRFPGLEARFFRPLTHDESSLSPRTRHFSAGWMIARLAPGATIEQAQQQLTAVDARAAATDPQASHLAAWGYHSLVRPFAADLVRDVKPTLTLLQFGAAFLLVIGIANLANLSLIRTHVRAGEIAVRHALGATVRHVAADALAESVLVSAAGAGLGFGLAWWALRFVGWFGRNLMQLGLDPALDLSSVVGAAAIAAIVALILAAPTVWLAARQGTGSATMRTTRSTTASVTARRLRGGFVVVQVSLAFVLLAGAAVLSSSLKRLLAQPLGFQPEHVLTGQLTLPRSRYPDAAAQNAFVTRLLGNVAALPGVKRVAISNGLPFTGMVGGGPVSVAGESARAGGRAHHRIGVTSDFAATMGLQVLAGRFLQPADDQDNRRVCVIDRAMADLYWPNQNPLGRELVFDTRFVPENASTVVGVVDVVKQNDLAEEGDFGTVYFPFAKFQTNFFYLAVRTELEPAVMASVLRRAVLQLDSELPLDDVRTLDQRVDATLEGRRTPLVLASVFAAVALLLATVGLYGVLAYAVSLRGKEFGIRLAIGAERGQIVQLVWIGGARLLAAGIAIGVVGSLLLARFVQALLFDTPGNDPRLLALVAVLLLATGSLACLVPATRASRVDPASALRSE